MVFKNLCAFGCWAKVASALEGFSSMDYNVNPLHLQCIINYYYGNINYNNNSHYDNCNVIIMITLLLFER